MTRAFWLLLALGLFLIGCGSSSDLSASGAGGQATGPQNPPVSRSTGPTLNKDLDSRGGSLEVVATDGTRFLLTIPAGALAGNTTITMAPVAVSGHLGLPVDLPYAVQIGPAGTAFAIPAQLAITVPAGQKSANFQPYLMGDSGLPMSLRLGTVQGQTITFTLPHLTTPGLSPSPVPNPPSVGSSADEAFEAEIASLLSAITARQLAGLDSPDDLLPVYQRTRAYFDDTLKPFLETTVASGTEAQCRVALRDALAFERLVQSTGDPQGVSFHVQLEPLETALLNRGIDQCINTAVTNQDWKILQPIPQYLVLAQALGVDSDANRLTLEKIQARIPLEVVVTAVDLPSPVPPTTTSFPIVAHVGYRLGAGNPILTNEALFTQIRLSGATPNSVDAFSKDGLANFDSTTFFATDAAPRLTADVTAVFTKLRPFEFSSTRRVTSENSIDGLYFGEGTISNLHQTAAAGDQLVEGDRMALMLQVTGGKVADPPQGLDLGSFGIGGNIFFACSGLHDRKPSQIDFPFKGFLFGLPLEADQVFDQGLGRSNTYATVINNGVLVHTFAFTNFQDLTGGYTFTLPLRVGPVHGRYNQNYAVFGDVVLRDFEFDVTLRKLVSP